MVWTVLDKLFSHYIHIYCSSLFLAARQKKYNKCLAFNWLCRLFYKGSFEIFSLQKYLHFLIIILYLA